MSSKYTKTNNIWSTLAKILIFIAALYLAYLILRPLLAIILGIGFWLIKVIVFVAAAIFVVHLFLKLIFDIDLLSMFFGKIKFK